MPLETLLQLNSHCSRLLQRRTVDFSSQRSFSKSAEALEEHYGIKISSSTIKRITETIGQKATVYNETLSPSAETEETLIAQIDGSMVPLVEYAKPTLEQKEKGIHRVRSCSWGEFKLCSVSSPEGEQTSYGVNRGTVDEAGDMMLRTCQKAGMGENTHIHGVADGAPWIADQYKRVFKGRHTFILDMYHALEYLGAAAKELPHKIDSGAWLKEKKSELKAGKSKGVILELKGLASVNAQASEIAKAVKYFANRADQLKYDEALEKNLPIGSGEVESGHKSVLQSRLKKPGAWWKEENAESMAQIQALRANNQWHEFWLALPS